MNIGKLFDSPAQLLIIVVIIVLLFGATRLPNAARQLGRSMRIFKSEIKEMKSDGKDGAPAASARTVRDDEVEPLEGHVVREHHAPRTTEPGAATSADGVRRDS